MNKAFFLLLIILGLSCTRKVRFSVIPKITYKSMQPKIIKAGASNGAAVISIYFEDGNGDIGFGTNNLYFKDSRDSSIVKMMIPVIPNDYSPEFGLKGTIEVLYPAALLTLRPDTAHIESDTLHWDIYLKDAEGNISNTIQTEDLLLLK